MIIPEACFLLLVGDGKCSLCDCFELNKYMLWLCYCADVQMFIIIVLHMDRLGRPLVCGGHHAAHSL